MSDYQLYFVAFCTLMALVGIGWGIAQLFTSEDDDNGSL